MAVVPRKRKNRTVYYVATSASGVPHWELVGTNKAEARALDAKRRREVKEGTFRPGQVTDAASVLAFATPWLANRKNRNADVESALVKRHVLSVEWFAELRMGDVRPRHVLKLIEHIKGAGKLAPKSIHIVMGVLRVMFRDAVIDEVITATPYVIPKGTLTRAGKKRLPYTPAEAHALMGPAVPERERAWNTMAFFGGLRCGELCGLRWGDWDEAPVPLGAISVSRQYEGQPLKTDRPRMVPVHPQLAAALRAWRQRWSLHFLHRPEPADPMFPVAGGGHQTKSSAYKAWLRSCKAAAVSNRSVHSTRHTMISVARRNGADSEVLELVTHNPKGRIIDVYTTREWAELCAAISCLTFDPPPITSDQEIDVWLDVDLESTGNSGSSAWTRTSEKSGNTEASEEEDESGEAEEPPRSPRKSPRGVHLDASQEFTEREFLDAVTELETRGRAAVMRVAASGPEPSAADLVFEVSEPTRISPPVASKKEDGRG